MKQGLFTLLMVFGLASVAAAQRGEPANSSMVVVNGEGHIRAEPDEASVRIGIVRQAATAQAAQDQANAVANDTLASIKSVGIPASDIQTSRLTLNPVYATRTDSHEGPRITGYQASDVVTVRVTDLNKIGVVIDAGLKSGSNEIQGVQFSLRDDLPARKQALKEAVSEAQKKADAIAEAAHVQLGAPLEISEGGTAIIPRNDLNVMGKAAFAATAPSTPVSVGKLEIRASVTIRYRIIGSAAKP